MAKNIEWWEQNVKVGDSILMDIKSSDKNYWKFNNKNKTSEIYFDGIYYPRDDMKQYFSPEPKFQLKKEDIGDKSKGFTIPSENIRSIKQINGEEVKSEHVTERTKRIAVQKKYVPNNFEIRNINGRWVCPCWSPEDPSKYSYSIRANAINNHKGHLARSHL